MTASSTATTTDFSESTSSTSEENQNDPSYAETLPKDTGNLDLAVKLKHAANLSLSQTVKVMTVLYDTYKEERFLPPARSSLYSNWSVYRNNYSVSFEKDHHILQFDGKGYVGVFGKKKCEVIAK